MKKAKMFDLTFGFLTVISEANPQVGISGRRRKAWLCLCICGNTKVILGERLRSGKTKSCNCYRKEFRKTHGFSKLPLYDIWCKIKARCYNKKVGSYPDYGGRGITVCNEWINNPEAFINWSLKNGYKKELDCDRRDNNKGYSPDNCRYVTRTVNLYNRRPYKKRKLKTEDPF